MEDLKLHIKNIRKNILTMIANANSGHPGGSLGAADILGVLYFEEMNINEANANSLDRDKFVLSKGHAAPVLYATLFEKGIYKGDLNTFRCINSKLQGHPNMNYVEGVDMSTGSLGQGISAAVGMAMANKLSKNENRVYTLLGDGECNEGQVWEAAMAAAHYKLDNLCAILDYNGLQIDGDTVEVMDSSPLDKKFEAFNWNVIKIDGNDLDQIREAFKQAKEVKGKPTLIFAKTVKGKGVSFMENNPKWHSKGLTLEEYNIAVSEINEQKKRVCL